MFPKLTRGELFGLAFTLGMTAGAVLVAVLILFGILSRGA